jgi:hypothetical protein
MSTLSHSLVSLAGLPAQNEFAKFAKQFDGTLLRQEIRELICGIDATDINKVACHMMPEMMVLDVDMSSARAHFRSCS